MAAEPAKFDLSRTYLRYAPMVVRRLRDLHADEKKIREALKNVFVGFLQEREKHGDLRISETLLHLCDIQVKGPSAPKPDLSGEGYLLERHFAGETGARENADVIHLSHADPSVAKRLELLRRGSEDILSLYPPASLLSEIKHTHWKKLAAKPGSVYGSANPQHTKKGIYIIAGVAAALILSTWLWEKNRGTYRLKDDGKNKPGKALQVSEIFVYLRTGLSEGQEKP
ncbi:MAG: hypothetical protein JNM63_04020, partial [Spirochaetia bacterium]|nr:hypothetical protein [Spirochaetia bacterium]